jgi:Tol biopolymer transport system component
LKSQHSDVPASLVQAELDRILASDLFARSERLSAFLKFIVDQTLAGHGDSLKEQVIAVELYGKDASFNTAADPIVRVDARRLRDKLREYYAAAPSCTLVIGVPKGSYTPVFQRIAADLEHVGKALEANEPLDVAGAVTSPPTTAGLWTSIRARRWWSAAVAVALIAAGALGASRLRTSDGSAPPRLLTVTSMPGAEEDPSLSPDGNFVAFSWDGGSSPDAPADIWIKAVNGDALRRLTSTPDSSEKWPAWSPDGRQIAFTRFINGLSSIYVISALGGPEQLIGEGRYASWLPDSRSLVLHSLKADEFGFVQHVIETGERRTLTQEPAGLMDTHPRVSPDGKMLAFSRNGVGRSTLLLVPMSGGQPTTLDGWSNGLIGGLAWTPDGQDILFARPEVSGRRLMRIRADGRAAMTPVSGVPYESLNPSVSQPLPGRPYRLAITTGQPQIGLRLVDLQAPREGTRVATASPFYESTRVDTPGRFSPDGSQAAFVSNRSGSDQVWVANRDGSGLRSVTALQDAAVNLGSWSPDGRSLTFDATIAGIAHIYVVSATGGPIKRLTDATATERDPEWSRDGRWIYYTSDESGRWTLWKIPASGGARVRLTSEAGFELRESPDGRVIYFIDSPRVLSLRPTGKLKKVSVDGGVAEPVDVPAMPGAWDVSDTGIVFIVAEDVSAGSTGAADVLKVYDFAERRVRSLAELPFRVSPFGVTHSLAVSRDGRWALASHIVRWERDILVVDNFR